MAWDTARTEFYNVLNQAFIQNVGRRPYNIGEVTQYFQQKGVYIPTFYQSEPTDFSRAQALFESQRERFVSETPAPPQITEEERRQQASQRATFLRERGASFTSPAQTQVQTRGGQVITTEELGRLQEFRDVSRDTSRETVDYNILEGRLAGKEVVGGVPPVDVFQTVIQVYPRSEEKPFVFGLGLSQQFEEFTVKEEKAGRFQRDLVGAVGKGVLKSIPSGIDLVAEAAKNPFTADPRRGEIISSNLEFTARYGAEFLAYPAATIGRIITQNPLQSLEFAGGVVGSVLLFKGIGSGLSKAGLTVGVPTKASVPDVRILVKPVAARKGVTLLEGKFTYKQEIPSGIAKTAQAGKAQVLVFDKGTTAGLIKVQGRVFTFRQEPTSFFKRAFGVKDEPRITVQKQEVSSIAKFSRGLPVKGEVVFSPKFRVEAQGLTPKGLDILRLTRQPEQLVEKYGGREVNLFEGVSKIDGVKAGVRGIAEKLGETRLGKSSFFTGRKTPKGRVYSQRISKTFQELLEPPSVVKLTAPSGKVPSVFVRQAGASQVARKPLQRFDSRLTIGVLPAGVVKRLPEGIAKRLSDFRFGVPVTLSQKQASVQLLQQVERASKTAERFSGGVVILPAESKVTTQLVVVPPTQLGRVKAQEKTSERALVSQRVSLQARLVRAQPQLSRTTENVLRSGLKARQVFRVETATRVEPRVALSARTSQVLAQRQTLAQQTRFPPIDFTPSIPKEPRPPIIFGFGFRGGLERKPRLKASFKPQRQTRGFESRLFPLADIYSKTQTEFKTGRPARQPPLSVARKYNLATYGLFVPTREMLAERKSIKRRGGRRK